MKATEIILAFLARLEELFLCLLLSAMIGLACLQVGMRLFFDAGLMWADPLLRHLVIWSGLFGAVAATGKGRHIAIDLVAFLAPPAWHAAISVLTSLFASLVCAGLTYSAILFIRSELEFSNSPALLHLPGWSYSLIYPLAFGLISLRFGLQAIAKAVALLHGQTPATVIREQP